MEVVEGEKGKGGEVERPERERRSGGEVEKVEGEKGGEI